METLNKVGNVVGNEEPRILKRELCSCGRGQAFLFLGKECLCGRCYVEKKRVNDDAIILEAQKIITRRREC